MPRFKASGQSRVEGIEMMDVLSRACRRIAIDGLFVYVGEMPNTGFLTGVVELDEHGTWSPTRTW